MGDHVLAPGDERFEAAVAVAHADRVRPLCLCQEGGIEMYIARLGDGYLIKRMPFTGNRHAAGCLSYEPPAEWSGLAALLGTAINENPATGRISLRLGFSLTRAQGRQASAASVGADSGPSAASTRLSLRALLHYLWEQADLTRWHPGFAGRRTWAVVRQHLLRATASMLVAGEPLAARLYIPEPFVIADRDAINARRTSQWTQAASSANHKSRPLLLLIAEVKELHPSRYGFNAIAKHVPDQAFMMDPALYRRLEQRFERALTLWGSTPTIHLIAAATFGLSDAGVPQLEEVTLMPVTGQWIPVDDALDLQLIDRLVHEHRMFARCLRYNAPPAAAIAAATLLDAGQDAHALWIERGVAPPDNPDPGWRWQACSQPMPALPRRIERDPGDRTASLSA
ncbi:MAG: DUF1173 domain-containing protein [Burkholderiaceae bacterium]|nr:DUF1173 domain-containing protein [Burkholderiaceae bacterium]